MRDTVKSVAHADEEDLGGVVASVDSCQSWITKGFFEVRCVLNIVLPQIDGQFFGCGYPLRPVFFHIAFHVLNKSQSC